MSASRLVYLLLLWALLLSDAAAAQSREAVSGTDTLTILQMLHKGDSLSNSNPSEAYHLYSQALAKSRDIQFDRGAVMALTKTGDWYFGNDISIAIHYGRQALQLYEEKKLADINLKAPIDLLLAEVYDEKGKQDSSAYFFYLLSDEMEKAQQPNPAFATNLYIKLTVFWMHMNYDTASIRYTAGQYVQKALQAAEGQSETSAARLNTFFLQGLYFNAIKEYDSSRYYFLRYFRKNQGMNMPRKISTLLNIAETHLLQHQPDKALDYVDQVLVLEKNPEYQVSLAYFLNEADFFKACILFQQEQYSQTIPMLQQYLTRATGKGKLLRYEMMDAHRMLGECYEHMGLYQKALEENKIHIRQQDSLSQKDKLDMINRLEMRYRIAQKDKELALQQLTITEARNNVRKKNFWIGIISLLAAGLAIIFVLWQRNSRHKQKLQAEKINTFQKEMEITRLHATLSGEEKERKRLAQELHDGVGGILAAARITLELSTQKLPPLLTSGLSEGIKLVEEAAIELRKTAHNMLPDVLETKGLVQAIKSFVYKVGHNHPTELIFQCYGTERRFSIIFELAIYRVVQELVHNILKHAHAGKAIVQMEFVPTGISITIEDDGVGMTEEVKTASQGIGLTNIYERVRTAGGNIDIESSPGNGTSIYLEFEIQAENQN